jgi:gentisate 1,2-dioxygenase
VSAGPPAIRYSWRRTEEQLYAAAKDHDGAPTDGVIFEYTNPLTGGPVLPTMSCYVQLKPGVHTAAHRHTSSAIYHVVRGGGYSVIGGEARLGGRRHDCAAQPQLGEA